MDQSAGPSCIVVAYRRAALCAEPEEDVEVCIALAVQRHRVVGDEEPGAAPALPADPS